MAVKFTDEQKLAIETLDKSVLVSAAAGSGKTAVLVERILSIILEGRANVDEMLVVTFTRAAASEMRLRLAREIRKRLRESSDDADRLRDQLARLYRAYISTIDSFALRVIREFFYETDIDPDAGMCDEVQGELMRREAAAELLEAGFDKDDFLSDPEGSAAGSDALDAIRSVGFREFLRLYSDDRSEDRFKEDMMSAYAELRSMPDYFEWAYERAEALRVTSESFDGSLLQKNMEDDARETFRKAGEAAEKARDLMYDAGLADMYELKLAPEAGYVMEISERMCSGSLDAELIEAAGDIPKVRVIPAKPDKESYEPIKAELTALRDVYKGELKSWSQKYAAGGFTARLSEMNETYRYTVYYIRMLEEFERRYQEKKREKRLMDFPDAEHGAVRILRNKDAAEILRSRFKYIFVDEYQDTNNIQETLISSVSRPDNVFRVGDLKQSIYKFRQAEPEIFQRVYRKYEDESQDEGITIDLSRNFRSNDATIRYINRVFSHIMDGYDEKAMLYTGTECPPEYDFIPEVHILTEEGMDDETSGVLEGPLEDIDGLDEEIAGLSKEEAEAAYIADIVAGLIGTEFYDTKAREVRQVRARDIVILFRAVKARGDIMARALRSRSIDSHIEESDDYFDTVEVGVALSMLSCIDNMKRDIPLIATLHSEAFGWTPAELARIRIAHNEHLRQTGSHSRSAYFEALEWYIEEGPDRDLRDKAREAAGRILEWRRLSRMMPLDEFVWKVIESSGYYMMAGAMNGGARRQANLRILADRAKKYSENTISSLSSFITFLDVMRKKKISNGQAPAAGAGDDVVRISTIHKSKGLEYPFVIVGGLGHDFHRSGSEKKFLMDSGIGVSLAYIDPARRYWRSTLMQRAITAKAARDSYSEELRVLYVAMTRARNKLILTGTVKSEERLMEYTSRPGNFLKAMRDVVRTDADRYVIRPLETRETAGKRYGMTLPDIPETLSEDEKAIYQEIDRRFTFVYEDEDLLKAKAKYSVSEIRRDETSDQPARAPSAGRRSSKVSAAEVGTAYHRVMEYLDFARVMQGDGSVDDGYIEESALMLRDRGAIDAEAWKAMDIGRIAEFFRSDLGRRAVRAAQMGSLRKEKPFTLKTARQGRDILVQGVIDCLFEEAGRLVLIDYKSSFVMPGRGHDAGIERIRSEYAVQIELYAEAVSKGLGREVSEAYLYLFQTGESVDMLTPR